MSEADLIARTVGTPPTRASLAEDLRSLGLPAGGCVLVHCSLKTLGWVVGGAVAVVGALDDVIGSSGTVMMPTQTSHLSDPATWRSPPVPESWHSVIREHMPAYDPAVTPTRGMGAVAECFRTQPGVERSAHPLVSFAARGPDAEWLVGGQSLDFAFGEMSPLARLYDRDGHILLLGVNHERNTSMHLAEYRATFASKREAVRSAPLLVNGRRERRYFTDLDINDHDFPRIGAAFEVHARPEDLRISRVGRATARLVRQRSVVDFATRWMEEHRP